jgi:hypothetical protein
MASGSPDGKSLYLLEDGADTLGTGFLKVTGRLLKYDLGYSQKV